MIPILLWEQGGGQQGITGCASAFLSTLDCRSWLSTPAAINWNTDTVLLHT